MQNSISREIRRLRFEVLSKRRVEKLRKQLSLIMNFTMPSSYDVTDTDLLKLSATLKEMVNETTTVLEARATHLQARNKAK